jgi:hypothetical protein
MYVRTFFHTCCFSSLNNRYWFPSMDLIRTYGMSVQVPAAFYRICFTIKFDFKRFHNLWKNGRNEKMRGEMRKLIDSEERVRDSWVEQAVITMVAYDRMDACVGERSCACEGMFIWIKCMRTCLLPRNDGQHSFITSHTNTHKHTHITIHHSTVRYTTMQSRTYLLNGFSNFTHLHIDASCSYACIRGFLHSF